MRLFILLAACWALLSPGVAAQKFLQLEKANRAGTTKFYVGQEMSYRLKGNKEWFSSTITDVKMDSQLVAFDWKNVPVGNIEALRLRHSPALRTLGPMLMIFGASWAGYSLVGAAFYGDKLTASTAIVAGTGLVSGFILQQIFKHKRVRLSERRRLRAVEIPLTGLGQPERH